MENYFEGAYSSAFEFDEERASLSAHRRFNRYDPVIGNTSQFMSWNQYAYVQNNPLINTDPNGLIVFRVGAGFQGGTFLSGGIQYSEGFAFGYSKEKGFTIGTYKSYGYGGYFGAGGSFGPEFFVARAADEVKDVGGFAGTTGISTPGGPAGLTGEMNVMDNKIVEWGLNPSVGGNIPKSLKKVPITYGMVTHTEMNDVTEEFKQFKENVKTVYEAGELFNTIKGLFFDDEPVQESSDNIYESENQLNGGYLIIKENQKK